MIIHAGNYILRSFSCAERDVKSFYEISHNPEVQMYVPYAYSQNYADARETVKVYSEGDCKNDFYLCIQDQNETAVGVIIAIRMYTTILDVSVLTAYPDIRGIVINANANNDITFNNGDLVGYRVEYFDTNNNRTDEFRIITSNNRCEPLMKAITSSNQKGITYRFNNSSNLI